MSGNGGGLETGGIGSLAGLADGACSTEGGDARGTSVFGEVGAKRPTKTDPRAIKIEPPVIRAKATPADAIATVLAISTLKTLLPQMGQILFKVSKGFFSKKFGHLESFSPEHKV